MKYIHILAFILISSQTYSQSKFLKNIKLYGGYTHTVVNDYIGSSTTSFNKLTQTIISKPLNSPNYLSTWHLGLSKRIAVNNIIFIKSGIRYVNRGTKDFGVTGIPVQTTLPERVGYLGIPILLQLKLLSNKDYFLGIGISNYLRIDPLASGTIHLIELDLEVNIPIKKKISTTLKYSNGLKPWKVARSFDSNFDYISKLITHSFEISLNYEI